MLEKQNLNHGCQCTGLLSGLGECTKRRGMREAGLGKDGDELEFSFSLSQWGALEYERNHRVGATLRRASLCACLSVIGCQLSPGSEEVPVTFKPMCLNMAKGSSVEGSSSELLATDILSRWGMGMAQ